MLRFERQLLSKADVRRLLCGVALRLNLTGYGMSGLGHPDHEAAAKLFTGGSVSTRLQLRNGLPAADHRLPAPAKLDLQDLPVLLRSGRPQDARLPFEQGSA